MLPAKTPRALLLTVGAIFSASAFAQATDSTETAAPVAADQNAEPIGDVVVTGSRIARPDFEAPNPIVSYDATNIQQSGNTNLTNFLARIPALTGSRDSTQTSGGQGTYGTFGQTGLNELNLRNLGTARTLVLVNGRRHVAAEVSTAAVDINSIPTDLIERVDVLTGAVSAIYGADGVTGVVNFILKKDFEGFAARTQYGTSDYGDADNRFVSLAAGKNFGDGLGNVTLAYEYNSDQKVGNDDRPFLRFSQRKYIIPNDAYDGTDQSIPQNILVAGIRYPGESPLGAVFVGGEGSPSYDGLGRPYDAGTPAAYYAVGGVSTEVAGFYQGDLFPKTERNAVNLLGHYDFSDAFKVSVESKFVHNRTSSLGQYTGTYYYPISLDNPFVPASIRDAAIASGATDLHVNRDNLDYGRPGEEDVRKTYRGVIDLSGRISDHANWDAYYEYGQTRNRIEKIGDRLNKQYTDALDAVVDPGTGEIVCNPANNPVSGCIPVSLFGPGPITPEQLAYFRTNDLSNAKIKQQVVSASISGDFGEFLPLPGGPIKYAVGGEYRRESSRFDPNDNLVNAAYFQYDEPSLVSASRGKFNVKEAFAEIELPILKDRRFANLLSIGAAGRYSDYSTVGTTKTWQLNGTYSPVSDVAFRGSYGKAVRAPNIGELFQPTFGTSAFFTDPCTPNQINNGTQYREANCATTLAEVGAVSSPALQTGNFINGTSSGNLNLSPEVAHTWTAGVLLRPSFLPGLNASLDWYDIDLKDAINQIDAGSLATLCVDQPTVPNQFCNQFTREQGTGIINSFVVGPLNVASFHTAGLDMNADYVIRTEQMGTFDVRLVLGYLHKLDLVGIPGAVAENQVDQPFKPQWTANFSPTWAFHNVTVIYNLRWNDAVRAFSRATTDASPNVVERKYLRFAALWQQDVQAKFDIRERFQVYAGVNNLTDRKPDPASYFTNVPISPLGRFFYAGARFDLRP
jgi:outer membrane receptor protein involved in Fe transport